MCDIHHSDSHRKAISVEQSVLEGARKEGQLVMYTSLDVPRAVTLLQEFKKRYPFVNTELFRSKSLALLNKIPQETRAKKYTADVITATFPIWNDLKRQGLLMKYKSPETRKHTRNRWKTRKIIGLSYTCRSRAWFITLNWSLQMRRRSDMKIFWIPDWKAKKIAMDYQEQPWFAVMLEILGKDKCLDFMGTAFENKISIWGRTSLCSLTLLAASEFLVLSETVYMDTVMG